MRTGTETGAGALREARTNPRATTAHQNETLAHQCKTQRLIALFSNLGFRNKLVSSIEYV